MSDQKLILTVLLLAAVAATAYVIAKKLKDKAALQADAKARYGNDWTVYNYAGY